MFRFAAAFLVSFMLCTAPVQAAGFEQTFKEAQAACGLQTIMDATPSDLPRDPEFYKIVQGETGVNIILTTGLFNEAEGSSCYWKYQLTFFGYDEAVKRLTESYMREVQVGICNTDVKSGMLKVATGKGCITQYEAACMEAVAITHKETGLPIISHTTDSTMGVEMADFLLERGADPKKTMIGHMSGTDDLDYVESVLKKGVYIGFDQFGYNHLYPDIKRCENLVKLVNKGYIRQILMGHDYLHYLHGGDVLAALRPSIPNSSLKGIFTAFNPILKEMGLTDEQLRILEVENPRNFFAGA